MPIFLKTVSLQNYKSIARCRVNLQSLTMLVGRNGAGKSNFVDSLRLVAESLRSTLEHALRDRGGINEVRRRSRGHPTHFGIRLDVQFPDGGTATYAFKIGALPKGGFKVQREECRVRGPEALSKEYVFVVENGALVESTLELRSRVESDRLYLTLVSALSEFRPLYDALSRMGFYNLNPERIRDLQEPDAGDLLARDGSNVSSVLDRLTADDPAKAQRIAQYLAAVVPGIVSVEPRHLGPKETLRFRQQVVGDKNPWQFMASNMSDGTLRALGVLVAAFQTNGSSGKSVSLVGIEEPELAVHPGAAEALLEAVIEASKKTQILLTTHSPDLLDHEGISADNILSVSSRMGETLIAPVDSATRKSLAARLFTAGELLRLGQIEPDELALSQVDEQLDLFARPTPNATPHNSNR